MGAGASSRSSQLSITDPKICRSFLAGTCPHDLFTNTKQDLGPCPKVHSEPLKTEYESSPENKQKYGFEYDYMRDLQKYIDECNRRIDSAQRRLEKTPDEIKLTNTLVRRFTVPLWPAKLTCILCSSSRFQICPRRSTVGCWRFPSWARKARWRARWRSTLSCARPSRARRSANASSSRCRTRRALRAIRSYRCATCAAPI